MGREITNCSECAYVCKTKEGLWCPFHDQRVSEKLVCDDFVGETETPQWTSLMSGMAGEVKKTPRFTGADIGAYILTAAAMILGAFPLFIAVFLI